MTRLRTRDRIMMWERLYRFPEVLLPMSWPEWSRAAESKVGFWEAFTPWRSGFLTAPWTDAPYHDAPCLFRDLDARKPAIGNTPRDIRFFRPRRTVGMNVEDDPVFAGVKPIEGVMRSHRAFDEEKDELREPIAKAGDYMEDKLAQFFLRNIGRVERMHDDVLEYDVVRTELRGFDDSALEEARAIERKYEAPKLLEQITYVAVKENVEAMRDLFFRRDWTLYFCRELKQALPGPLWKHFPNDEWLATFGHAGSQKLDLSLLDEHRDD